MQCMKALADGRQIAEGLRNGWSMSFELSTGCLLLFDEDGHPVRWKNGDNKRPAAFIRSREDFERFAFLLVEILGIRIQRMESVPTCSTNGHMITFVRMPSEPLTP